MTDNSNISAYNLVTKEKVQVAGGSGSENPAGHLGDDIAYVRMSPSSALTSVSPLDTRATSVVTPRPGEQTLPSLARACCTGPRTPLVGVVVVGKNLSTGASAPLNAGDTHSGLHGIG